MIASVSFFCDVFFRAAPVVLTSCVAGGVILTISCTDPFPSRSCVRTHCGNRHRAAFLAVRLLWWRCRAVECEVRKVDFALSQYEVYASAAMFCSCVVKQREQSSSETERERERARGRHRDRERETERERLRERETGRERDRKTDRQGER